MQLSKNVRHSFTTREYGQLMDAGILSPDVRVELIRGEIMERPPHGSEHASIVAVLHERLAGIVQPHGHIRCGMPIVLDERSQPEPDLAIVRARADHYRSAHPTAQDALLLVEVADQTLNYDRTVKASLYASARVAALWIIDTAAGELHCLTEPATNGYRQRILLRRDGRLSLPSPFNTVLDLSNIL
jgi:Uma2 family endonuclease